MKGTDIYREYCTGCGLCHSEKGVSFARDEKGFWRPEFHEEDGMENFLESVCPAGGNWASGMDPQQAWGGYQGIYEAYSADPQIRRKASSGGVLTSLAIFLLESGRVDGIIHAARSEEHPFHTQCYCSTTKEEVISRCGSRYAVSSPLSHLRHITAQGGRYCVIGRPCDISALRCYRQEGGYAEKIPYLLSFFCAGMPSDSANARLLHSLGCSEGDCASLDYRGNGWPGRAVAVRVDGTESSLDYNSSWGGILGRDIHKFCRLCMDGIGEAADVACADGWYSGADGQPDFTERDGRNLVFTRTEEGEELFRAAAEQGYLKRERWKQPEQLQVIQRYQYVRRATMQAKIKALRLMGKPVPRYRPAQLREYAGRVDIRLRFRVFAGTVKRIYQKKL